MSQSAISVQDLSKRYIIRHQVNGRDGLRHALESALRNPLAWLRRRNQARRTAREEFWALKNVSFEVKAGDVVGVIGRNGAGKSTLLKVLSRITDPTGGRIQLQGRVASLLEVGTGFHQELTGRENIYLNGAILGMGRAEIRRKFDEIVTFSEIEQFLDTPVKRYSSGMYVRLAFAVAAHLEPDILIIDEVLAVGDTAFQQKCLGKMDEVSRGQGRTILFVSHNMGVIKRLCNTSILLERGQLRFSGATSDVISRYLHTNTQVNGVRLWNAPRGLTRADDPFLPRALRIRNARGQVAGHVAITQPFHVEFEYSVASDLPRFRVAFRFITSDGTVAFTSTDSLHRDFDTKPVGIGTFVTRCTVPGDLLNEGPYVVRVSADVPFQQVLFVEEGAITVVVEQTGGISSRYPETLPGAVCPALQWQTERVPSTTPLEMCSSV
jgi:lipopolysaccharide transport system ATP-binding protein